MCWFVRLGGGCIGVVRIWRMRRERELYGGLVADRGRRVKRQGQGLDGSARCTDDGCQ